MVFSDFHFYSEVLGIQTAAYILLPQPQVAAQSGSPIPVLYLLHGLSDDHTMWLRQTRVEQYAQRYRLAVVMPAANRSFYMDMAHGAKYETFVSRELPSVIERYFPVCRKRSGRFIAGLSMGGYGALINGLRYSDTFSKIGMLSPALGMYPENGKMQPGSPLHRESMLALLGDPEHYHGSYRDYEAAMRKALEKPQDMPRLFLACGTEDPLVYQAGRDFAHRMQAEGAPMTYYEAQGGHDHVFWKHAMTPLCEFLTAKGGK